MIQRLFACLVASLCAVVAHAANPQVEFKTSLGSIVLELDAELAPKTTANFLRYVQDGHYNGTVFHRVIPGFMIQGGGMDAGLKEKPGRAPIENEAANGLKNEVGTVAMARTRDPHSASAQFFINVASNTFLNHPGQDGWGYCVFGKVVKGMDVVRKIEKLQTRTVGMYENVPVDMPLVESAQVLAPVVEKAPEPVKKAATPTPKAASATKASRPSRATRAE